MQQSEETSLSRVLVLMATFNGSVWIEKQLASIERQENVDVSLMVSDDGSSDDTVEQLRRHLNGPLELTICDFEPSGSAAANFFALIAAAETSNYDYVAFADQDDVWDPDKLRRAISHIEASGAAGYSAAVRAVWPNGRTTLLKQRATTTSADYLFEGAGQGCTFVLRVSAFASIQRVLAARKPELTGLGYHDWTIYALSRAQGASWFFDPVPCMQYRQHTDNDTGARTSISGVSRRLASIRSGWYGNQIALMARLCEGISEDSTRLAKDYLQRRHAASSKLSGRLRLCSFVLRSGRRSWLDRLILLWAAATGLLSRSEVA